MRTRRPAYNQRGASLLLALLALLVVTMVSIVMLRAATANVARVRRNQAAEQAYLSVTSAAHLLIDAIEGDRYTFGKTITYTYTRATEEEAWDVSTTEADYAQYKEAEAEGKRDNPLQALLIGLVQSSGSLPAQAELVFKVCAEGSDELAVPELLPVRAVVSMTNEANGRQVTIRLAMENADEADYHMVLTCMPNPIVTAPKPPEEVILPNQGTSFSADTRATTTLEWNSFQLDRGGSRS